MICVYIMRHSQSGLFYIGATNDYKRRGYEHLKTMKAKTHANARIQEAFNDCHLFTWEALPMETIEEAKKLELELIHSHEGNPLLANIMGRPQSEEHRQAISAANKGRVIGPEWREAMSRGQMGREVTQETRDKIGLANKANPPTRKALEKSSELRSVKVIVEGTVYPNILAASREYDIHPKTVRRRIQHPSPEWRHWKLHSKDGEL